MLERVRARPWGIATVALNGDETAIRVDQGQDAVDETTLFEVGSVTKTVTGALLAASVTNGEATLATTVGDIVGAQAGAAKAVSLLALATHRSGLPRLPPNLSVDDVNPDDPYADFDEACLLDALSETELSAPLGEYSNYGFMLLGWLLGRLASSPYADLARERIFRPMGLPTARVGAQDAGALPGYQGTTAKPWWRQPLPGAGAVAMSATDLAGYLRAHVDEPPDSPLGAALTMAASPHTDELDVHGLGWAHQGGGWWHNGGTGGFRAFAAFHRPTRTAVGLMANSADAAVLDGTGFAALTKMVRATLDDAGP